MGALGRQGQIGMMAWVGFEMLNTEETPIATANLHAFEAILDTEHMIENGGKAHQEPFHHPRFTKVNLLSPLRK
ncbi:MAG: hypothetical protein AB7F31_04005 [Parachlamydiales bacterium]